MCLREREEGKGEGEGKGREEEKGWFRGEGNTSKWELCLLGAQGLPFSTRHHTFPYLIPLWVASG